jgi:hypothetical protein
MKLTMAGKDQRKTITAVAHPDRLAGNGQGNVAHGRFTGHRRRT